MSHHHTIIGHFGSADKSTLPARVGDIVTELDLVAGEKKLDHGIGRALDDLSRMGVVPTEIGLDLLILAAHVHAADTRISRDSESQDTWTREIRLVVPVSDTQKWGKTSGLLGRMLNFLTGDKWEIEFRARPATFAALVPAASLQVTPFDRVSLFSGGLDSLIGAIDTLEDGCSPLLVSHAGEGAVSNSQAALFAKLEKAYSSRSFDRFRLWMSFAKDLIKDAGQENTTRARSFLFIATAAFVGSGLRRTFTIVVPENGFIALNVPLDPLRLGAMSTRTTHPFFLARWNELLSALGIAGEVRNPYWDKTKGEMVQRCKNLSLLRSIVGESLSCASPTKGRWLGQSTGHCGYCLPCLIRRAALHAGLGVSDPTPYSIPDLAAQPLDAEQAEGQQVRSFQFAIQRLKSKPKLADLLIHKPGRLSDLSASEQAALAGVYARGLAEVGSLLAKVRTISAATGT